jgi:5-methylcytosine-specific restriction endonuclease McrA
MAAADDDLLIERLLRVIDEGRRTATYKLALLLALIDCCALDAGSDAVPTRAIAARVVELYFPQARRYVAADGVGRELRQISTKTSPPLRAVFALSVHADAHRCRTAREAAQRFPALYAETVDAVEDTFVRYPIPLLQVVGDRPFPFLYELDWPEGTSVRTLRKEGRDVVRLRPGVAARLIVLGPLLRPLIEHHWTQDVARWSKLATEDDRLRTHLFGAERIAFPSALRDGLRELQNGRCFYCDAPLADRVEVDHFLPWARWPNDAIENLVLADRCNGSKSDHLAAAVHVEHWAGRLHAAAGDLREIASDARWDSDAGRSLAHARSTYTLLAVGTPLWLRGRDFVAADPSVHEVLAAAG